ncbi:MAG: GNAT family N-acetyltransferase [SAR324 cluster bacterium]
MHVPTIQIEGADSAGADVSPFLIRQLGERDLPALLALDGKISGRPRTRFLSEKFAACVSQPGLNTSLAAGADGRLVAFLMGRVFFGEFGVPMSRAVLDVLGVQPEFRRAGAARALVTQYVKNVTALRVEALDTLVAWDRFDLLGFFKSLGFRPSRTVDLEWDLASHPFVGRPGPAAVRPARADDLAEVANIDAGQVPPARPAYFAAKLEGQRHAGGGLFLVAEIGGAVAGFVVGSLFQGEFGIAEVRGVVESIGVAEAHRGSGVGSSLIAELRDRAVLLGATRMETLCHWDQWELLRFFAYIGFRPSPRLNLELRLTEFSP